MKNAIEALLRPGSIAILGASADFNKINGRTLKALLDKHYAGKIYPVNPKYDTLAGIPCYPDVASIPGPVHLAVVAVPAKLVASSIRELGKKGALAAIVFSSGFSEVGGDGIDRERALKAAIEESGVRVLGPNCLGLLNSFQNVMATFSQFSLGATLPGPVAFVTQSGALGTATAGMARRRGLNFGYFVNTGNEIDVNFVEVMREVLANDQIRVGAGYIEGLKDGPGLLELAAAALARGKPMIITKVGRTPAGARAVASHTGSLAGADAVFDGIVRQHGIVRARSDEQLLDFCEVFSKCALPAGPGLGIMTRSGGAGALMADRAEELGLTVATLALATIARLKEVVPVFGSTRNPVDITAQGLVDPGIMRESLKIMLADPAVDAGVVWFAFTEKEADATVRTLVEARDQSRKPFVVSWVGAPEHALKALQEAGVAVLRGAEPAIDAVAALVRYAEVRTQWLADEPARRALAVPQLSIPPISGVLPTLDAARLLQSCGVTLAHAALARDAEAAVACAERIGYPVAVKIESPDIPHKTEAHGVKLGLNDANAVRVAYAEVTGNAARFNPQARIDGVIVQRMAAGDVELVIGLTNDSVFGTVVMVGLGGIHVEVLKDVAFRKAPVTEAEAGRMLDELKACAILRGVRGKPAADRVALTRLIRDVSLFGAAAGSRLQEADINPVLAASTGATAVDWLVMTR
jgi:acetate---CoA ligase (ADP-forming)